jgi:hypothetical protein
LPSAAPGTPHSSTDAAQLEFVARWTSTSGGRLMRRVRASFLLRCVILAASVAVFAGVVLLARSTGWSVGTGILVAIVWFVGIEFGALPFAIERAAARRAASSGRPVTSIWFVDLDEQRRRELQAFHDDTEDNPRFDRLRDARYGALRA